MFAFNPHAEVSVARVGRCGFPAVSIDNVFENPQDVAALGFAQPYAEDPTNLYPGVRAAMPSVFSAMFRAWLTPLLQRASILAPEETLYRETTSFSVVTTASE